MLITDNYLSVQASLRRRSVFASVWKICLEKRRPLRGGIDCAAMTLGSMLQQAQALDSAAAFILDCYRVDARCHADQCELANIQSTPDAPGIVS